MKSAVTHTGQDGGGGLYLDVVDTVFDVAMSLTWRCDATCFRPGLRAVHALDLATVPAQDGE